MATKKAAPAKRNDDERYFTLAPSKEKKKSSTKYTETNINQLKFRCSSEYVYKIDVYKHPDYPKKFALVSWVMNDGNTRSTVYDIAQALKHLNDEAWKEVPRETNQIPAKFLKGAPPKEKIYVDELVGQRMWITESQKATIKEEYPF